MVIRSGSTPAYHSPRSVSGVLVEPEEVGIAGVRFVLDEHRHVVHQPRQLRRNPVQSLAHQLLELFARHLQHPAIVPYGDGNGQIATARHRGGRVRTDA
ncbi:hypothetical protein SBADM41S_08740 [Streptomyces badius]